MSTKPAKGGSTGHAAAKAAPAPAKRPQRPKKPASRPKKPAKPATPANKTAAHHAARVHAKKRGWTPGDVACCTVEALAASLRCEGWTVTDDDVLALFDVAGGDGEGLVLADAIGAAARYGLAGIHVCAANLEIDGPDLSEPCILGIDTPGPHTVFADSGVWWSWGELYSPWDARIGEAWAVRWGL